MEAIKTKQGAIDKNLRMNRMISSKKSIMNVLIEFQEISHEDRQLFDELVDSFNWNLTLKSWIRSLSYGEGERPKKWKYLHEKVLVEKIERRNS
jgi:hypothetical protein